MGYNLKKMICWSNRFCIFHKIKHLANRERIIWFWYKFPIIMNIYPSKCYFLWLITGLGDNLLITLQKNIVVSAKEIFLYISLLISFLWTIFLGITLKVFEFKTICQWEYFLSSLSLLSLEPYFIIIVYFYMLLKFPSYVFILCELLSLFLFSDYLKMADRPQRSLRPRKSYPYLPPDVRSPSITDLRSRSPRICQAQFQ